MASVATRTHSHPRLPNSLEGRLAYLASLRVAWEGKVRAGAQGGQSGCLLPSAPCQAGLVVTSVPCPAGQQCRELGLFLPASAPPTLLGLATTDPRIPGLEGPGGNSLGNRRPPAFLQASSDKRLTPSQASAPLVLAVTLLLALPPPPSQASQSHGVIPPLMLGCRPGEQF